VPLLVRFLDLVALALAFPVFALTGLPMIAYAVAGGAWILQRLLQELLLARAERSSLNVRVGIVTASMVGRSWLCAFAIFGVGIAEGDEAGLSAALLVIALFTVYFLAHLAVRPFMRDEPGAGAS
jgi:hypothetical protein